MRRPISRVRRETLTDISEKMASADRNKTSAVTPACAPSITADVLSCRRIHSSSGRASLDIQSGIDIGRDDAQTRDERGRIAANAHTHHERRHRSRRRRAKRKRLLGAVFARIQAQVADDADDLEPAGSALPRSIGCGRRHEPEASADR